MKISHKILFSSVLLALGLGLTANALASVKVTCLSTYTTAALKGLPQGTPINLSVDLFGNDAQGGSYSSQYNILPCSPQGNTTMNITGVPVSAITDIVVGVNIGNSTSANGGYGNLYPTPTSGKVQTGWWLDYGNRIAVIVTGTPDPNGQDYYVTVDAQSQ